jgi:hypothetical protein
MIIEPRKSAEEIDRRLSALTDPELSELLKDLNQGLLGDDLDSYASPYAPYWKRRIGLLALAGLFAMSVGFGAVAFQPQSHSRPPAKAATHAAAIALPHPHRPLAQHKASKRAVAPIAYRAPVTAPAAVPDEAAIRQARAQLLHERAMAAQAQARAAQAEHQAKVALQAQAAAQRRAHAEALAQAQAEAIAQQRARALSQAQAQAQAQDEQTRADALAREAAEQDWVRAHTSGPGTKSVDVPPGDNGRLSTGPSPRVPLPMPGPVDPNCTPHRGSLFTSLVTTAVLSHVKVGGTNLNAYVQLRP